MAAEYLFGSEDIARGALGNISPLSVQFSPDGKLLTYLFPDERGVRKVFAVSVVDEKPGPHFKLFETSSAADSGELSLQEQLRRERMRLFTLGISAYEWSEKQPSGGGGGGGGGGGRNGSEDQSAQKMIIPLNGKILLYDPTISSVASEQCHLIFDGNLAPPTSPDSPPSSGDAVDPHLSPDGRSVAFVANDDLYVLHIPCAEVLLSHARAAGASGAAAASQLPYPIRLTSNGAKPGVTCGLADFLAQEEMDRYRGFWWSPDSRHIVYAEADESAVPEYSIMHLGKDDPTHAETHRYPFAGKANPVVKLAVVLVPQPTASTTTAGHALAQDEALWLDLVDANDPAYTTVESLMLEASDADAPASTTTTASEAAAGTGTTDIYVCRVGWWPDGSVMVQVENRAQSVLQLLRVDPLSGRRSILLEEKSAVWINLHDMLHCFDKGWAPPQLCSGGRGEREGEGEGDFYFMWASERSGFSQLYLYQYQAASATATCLSGDVPIGGGGEFVVESIDAVDTDRHLVYFSGNRDAPTERHLYCASYLPASAAAAGAVGGGGKEGVAIARRVTTQPGYHSSTVLPQRGLVADVYSSTTCPPVFTLYKLQASSSSTSAAVSGDAHRVGDGQTGDLVQILEISNSSTLEPRFALHRGLRDALLPPSTHIIRSHDDKVDLYCQLYLPPHVRALQPEKQQQQGLGGLNGLNLPCVVAVYGGPHVQYVRNHWLATADLRAQRLAQLGFAVLKCDNRGSYRRGLAFEGAVRWDMGNIEVLDQQTAVRSFAQQGVVDPARVGMVGWSYGGYMSAMSICRAPDTFKCAVAGAPVTSWDGYDTHYTERYMGTPQGNPAGYSASSVMQHTAGMTARNKLMLVHGLIDENVHFRHTARLVNALIARRLRYELVLFPCERHSPHRLQDRIYMEDIMVQFFLEHLNPASATAPYHQQVIEGGTGGGNAGSVVTSADGSTQSTSGAASVTASTTTGVKMTAKI